MDKHGGSKMPESVVPTKVPRRLLFAIPPLKMTELERSRTTKPKNVKGLGLALLRNWYHAELNDDTPRGISSAVLEV
ncbi:hypothetical protein ALQ48_04053 [Pseudomonas coronafaciens pv. zizaniae]|jgi:hypothetical protein|nr:hypothetical protein ALQ48_04053 [Pseudomonas coronafaciens pv. zizaniae]